MVDWTAFWSHWAWPMATGIIVTLFTFLLFRQFFERRKYHQLAWTIGFLMFAIAAFMEAYSELVNDWNPTVYRIYIVMAGVLVGFLGLGTFYLIVRKEIIGHIYMMINIALMGVFLFGTFTVDLIDGALIAGVTVGGEPLGASGSFPRVMSMLFTIPGTILLIGGSIYSIIFFARKKQFSYRVWANVLIILGTLVIAGAGGRARAGDPAGLYPAEMLAAAILLCGFLKASTLQKGAEIKKALRKEK